MEREWTHVLQEKFNRRMKTTFPLYYDDVKYVEWDSGPKKIRNASPGWAER